MPSLSLLRRGHKHDHQRPISPQKQQLQQLQQQQQQHHQEEQEQPQLSPRHEDGIEDGPQRQLSDSSGHEGTGVRERKFSTRDLFGGLLGRSKGRGSSSSASTTAASSTKSGRGTGAESPTKLPVSRKPPSFRSIQLVYTVHRLPLPVSALSCSVYLPR
ncbi:hypothetical protein LZ31DRAFT_103445 [Colletotrichum somersetense]|nr:hypothetical protein LZ31DRAFT_103445 [Colletotrichum somersetense]